MTFVENFKSYFPRTKPCILLLFPCWPIFMQSYTQLMKFSSSLETSRDGKLRMSAFTSSNPTQCNGSTCKISNLCAGFQNVHKKICIFVVQRQNQFFYFFQRKYNLLGYRDLFPIDGLMTSTATGGKLKEQPTHSIIPTTPHSHVICCRSLQLVELIRIELKCHILSLHFRYHISRSHLHITFAKYDKMYNAKSLTCNFIEF